jgi:hypothetical protein
MRVVGGIFAVTSPFVNFLSHACDVYCSNRMRCVTDPSVEFVPTLL